MDTNTLAVGQEIWFGEFTAFERRGVVVEVTPDGAIVAEDGNKNRLVPFWKQLHFNGSPVEGRTYYQEKDAHFRTRHPEPIPEMPHQPWSFFG
jgi:hypothetical protein